MKRLLIITSILLAIASPVMAAGLLQPKNSLLPALQIEEHHVSVVINNGFAITEVDQTFRNDHDQDLDAVYTFPLPRNASLSELSLWIDGQEVIGEVVEKEEARRIASEEKAAGRETAVAEQREYYAFDVLVSPVRAASSTRVRLVYLQPVEIDGGVGRYVYPLEDGEVDEEIRSFWERRATVHGKFSFKASIRSAYPLDDVRAKGFARSVVTQDTPDNWSVWIDSEEAETELDQDIAIYYRLAENTPARVDLLPYRSGDGPGSFMLVITPGADLQPIVEGVDWCFVLDTSGSMSGKIATAADALARSLDEMRPKDRYRIFTFGNRAEEFTRGWIPATSESIAATQQKLGRMGTDGGTNLFHGLQKGLDALDADRTSAVILVSDGGANVGPTEYTDFKRLMGRRDVRLFTFVMGQGANRPLLERLANESNGFAMDISNQDDLYGRIMQAKTKLAREAMHGVEVELKGAKLADVTPQSPSSLYFGQQVVLFGRYFEPGQVSLLMKARISGEEKRWETTFEMPSLDESYPEIERLWAFERIAGLQRQIDDEGDRSELRKAIVDIGTEYSIVSEHTSMIVVREDRFEELGIDRNNKRRTETERAAREVRLKQQPQVTRVDTHQPISPGQPSHSYGGGGGLGAVGPGFLGLLAGIYGLRKMLRRKGDRA